jgi:hypothetical protein
MRFVVGTMALGQVSPSFSVFPVNIIPSWLSMLIYHLKDEQYARWWQQIRDMVSPNRHE